MSSGHKPRSADGQEKKAKLQRQTTETATQAGGLSAGASLVGGSSSALRPDDVLYLQRTAGNQVVQRLLSDQSRPVAQSEPVIQRTVHKRYVRQWQDGVNTGVLSEQDVTQLRSLVGPLSGKTDSKLKSIMSTSNFITKHFKNKTKRRTTQALLWKKLLELGVENMDALRQYKTSLTGTSSDTGSSTTHSSDDDFETLSDISVEDNAPQQLDFHNPPWNDATGAVVKASGNGGVVIVEFANGKIVVKAAKSGGLTNEVFGSRLAQSLGMRSPDMRFADGGEVRQIDDALRLYGKQMPASPPYVVIRYVPGVTGSEFSDSGQKLQPAHVQALGRSVGQWLAFDLMIREHDRFGMLASTGQDTGLNTANFMIDPQNVAQGFTSIDQNVSHSGQDKVDSVYDKIMKRDNFFAYTLGRVAAQMIPGRVDEEELGDHVLDGAYDSLRNIGQRLDENAVRQAAQGLDISEETIESIMYTVTKAARL